MNWELGKGIGYKAVGYSVRGWEKFWQGGWYSGQVLGPEALDLGVVKSTPGYREEVLLGAWKVPPEGLI